MSQEIVMVKLPTLIKTLAVVNYLWDSTAPIGVAPAASYTNKGHGITGASTTLGPLRKQYPDLIAIMVQVSCTGQDVTLKYSTVLEGDTAWTVWNGSGSGVAITASTPAEYTFDVWGNETQITLTNGGTGPTTLSASLKLVMGDRGGA